MNRQNLNRWDRQGFPDTSYKPSFLKYFTTPTLKAKWRMELNNRRKKADESVMTYYLALEKLWKGIGTFDTLPEEEKKEKFIQGLPSQMMISVVQQNPQTLDAALEQAKTMEIALTYGGQADTTTNQVLLTLLQKVESLEKKADQPDPRVYYTNQNRGRWQPGENRSNQGYNRSNQGNN